MLQPGRKLAFRKYMQVRPSKEPDKFAGGGVKSQSSIELNKFAPNRGKVC